jgi:aldehyde:ferredoxin oxidoreductase
LTNAIASSSYGGEFGGILKNADCDGIIVRGCANDPVYIEIEEEVKINGASEIWGLYTEETFDKRIRGG